METRMHQHRRGDRRSALARIALSLTAPALGLARQSIFSAFSAHAGKDLTGLDRQNVEHVDIEQLAVADVD